MRCLVITGASSGIGYATAQTFLSDGYHVINLSRSGCDIDGVVNFSGDLADPSFIPSISESMGATVADADSLCLVHNAARLGHDTIQDIEADALRQIYEINLVAPTMLNRLLLPHMTDGSSILYVGSTLGEKAVPGSFSYVVSKHASIGMMRASCQDLARTQSTTQFAIVRFGNVLGSSGSVVPLFKQQIAAGGPVTVTNADVLRYFMTIPEAAQLVIQAGSLTKGGDIFVLDMGEPLKILEIAKKMIVLSGKKPVLEPASGVGSGDILIRITGLRAGEKMFEELSYSDNLIGTAHPRILSTDDSGLSGEDLATLLSDMLHTIAVDDYRKLFEIVRGVFKDVGHDVNSSDVFFSSRNTSPASSVLPLSTSSNL